MIPKKIHYVWLGKKPYPLLIKKCMKSWQNNLKGYEFKLWNEENSPLNIPYVRKALKEKQYAFASDYIRMYALYTEGGIYLDTDMEVIKNFDDLLTDDFFIGRESEKWISAGIIGSIKGHEIIRKIMKEIENRTTYETLPKIITLVINNKKFNSKIKIYNEEYFYPFHLYKKENGERVPFMYMDVTKNTYTIHHWAKSWNVRTGNSTGICSKLLEFCTDVKSFLFKNKNG